MFNFKMNKMLANENITNIDNISKNTKEALIGLVSYLRENGENDKFIDFYHISKVKQQLIERFIAFYGEIVVDDYAVVASKVTGKFYCKDSLCCGMALDIYDVICRNKRSWVYDQFLKEAAHCEYCFKKQYGC